MRVIEPYQRHTSLAHGCLRPTSQKIGAVYFDEIRMLRPEELLDLLIIGENAMVRVVKESRAFDGIERRAKEGLLGMVCPRHNDGMIRHPIIVCQIAGFLQEIGVHAASAAIDIQGGEITDTHDIALVSRFSILLGLFLPQDHFNGWVTLVPAGTWRSNCASLITGFMVKVVMCMRMRVPLFSICASSWGWKSRKTIR